ncbi:Rpn family recombination-promoting nuclease/putative transposase, partial [Peptococcaceae bacterium]|nr:Rpn family recombination-promoting nuclease/putative transposase [Peptococcaceae bacterium]
MFEHKSKVYHDISLQLLGYMLNIWKSVANPTSGKLPVIIPLLIYHGRYQWNIGLKLSDLLQQIPNAVQKHVPDYEYILYDLSGFTEDDIKGKVKGRLFLETLVSVFKPDFYERVYRILQLMNELEQKEGVSAYIETVMLYIMNVREDLTVKKFMQIDKEYKTGRGDMIMSLAEQLRQEGRQEGRQDEKLKTARKMLMKSMDVDDVVELTELPKDEVLK